MGLDSPDNSLNRSVVVSVRNRERLGKLGAATVHPKRD